MTSEEQIIAVINDQKGQIVALHALAVALLRAMPLEMRAQAMREWDLETEAAKTIFLNSTTPNDDVAAAFDRYVGALNALRIFPPK